MLNSIIGKGLLLVSVFALSTGFSSVDKVTVKGSDTMVILSQRWAERL